MIVDSHAHAWRRWPYEPPVPDPDTRGSVDQLLRELDDNGVDRAVLVSARIGGNADNNDYAATAVAAHPDRLSQLVEVDSHWSPEYHTAGAADRLRAAADRWPGVGVTHYLRPDNDSWLTSDAAADFFTAAESLGLLVSLAARPAWQADLRALADTFSSLTFLVHHLGAVRPWASGGDGGLAEVVATARCPNVYVKISGFAYQSPTPWEYPYPDAVEVIRALHAAYGARRLCWGSDYPVSRPNLTYRQSLEVVRTHCDFLSDTERRMVLGDNLARVLHLS